jgi:hypothetical protein
MVIAGVEPLITMIAARERRIQKPEFKNPEFKNPDRLTFNFFHSQELPGKAL